MQSVSVFILGVCWCKVQDLERGVDNTGYPHGGHVLRLGCYWISSYLTD